MVLQTFFLILTTDENEDQSWQTFFRPLTAWIRNANSMQSLTISSMYINGWKMPKGIIDNISRVEGSLKWMFIRKIYLGYFGEWNCAYKLTFSFQVFSFASSDTNKPFRPSRSFSTIDGGSFIFIKSTNVSGSKKLWQIKC